MASVGRQGRHRVAHVAAQVRSPVRPELANVLSRKSRPVIDQGVLESLAHLPQTGEQQLAGRVIRMYLKTTPALMAIGISASLTQSVTVRLEKRSAN